MYDVKVRVGKFLLLTPTQEDGDELEEVVLPGPGVPTGWLAPSTGARPRCTRKAGESLGGWDGDWHAVLRDRRPPSLRRRRRVRLAHRFEVRAHRGRGPRRLGAGGPLGAGQRSRRPRRRAGAPGAARRLRPDGPTGRAARPGRGRADRGVVGVFRPVS